MPTLDKKVGKTKKSLVKMGRPTKYTDTLATEICNRISLGESLYTICSDEHIPDRLTVLRWCREREDFRNQYAKSKEEQAESYEDQMLHTARTEDDVNRARLIIDTMKWTAAKLKPRKYGERLDVTSDGEKVVPIMNITLTPQAEQRDLIEGEIVEPEAAQGNILVDMNDNVS